MSTAIYSLAAMIKFSTITTAHRAILSTYSCTAKMIAFLHLLLLSLFTSIAAAGLLPHHANSRNIAPRASSSSVSDGLKELIIILKPNNLLKSKKGRFTSSKHGTLLNDILSNHKAEAKLVFGNGKDEDQLGAEIQEWSSRTKQQLRGPNITTFYHITAPQDELDILAKQIRALDCVEAAYVKPPIGLANYVSKNLQSPSRIAKRATPNYRSLQTYLDAAPGGIDIASAAEYKGGLGDNINIVDVEWNWLFTHEDLKVNQRGIIFGTPPTTDNNYGYENHGTAVAGVLSGDINNFGIVGITPNAIFGGSSVGASSLSAAIYGAAAKMNNGDVLQIEVQGAGPVAGSTTGQLGFIPVEWWPDTFAAIQYATKTKGLIVVEAGGNGGQNLDDPIYTTARAAWFGDNSPNPFDIKNPSSGAIIVGAGAPPPLTHGRYYGPDRSRMDFSNYGARVDTQGWGVEVTTTGSGTLGDLSSQPSVSRNLWYTENFGGTSSATPIVTGAIAAVQAILKARNKNKLLTSQQMASIIRLEANGSPQQDGVYGPASQRIGPRPDLKKLIPAAIKAAG
jgi:hypothetical protein